MAEHLEQQRRACDEALLNAAYLRELGGIIDPDPESKKARLQLHHPESPGSQEAISRYQSAKAEYIDARAAMEGAQLRFAEARIKAAPREEPE